MSAISNEPFTPRTTGAIREAILQPVTVNNVSYERIRLQFKKNQDFLRIAAKEDFTSWLKEIGPYYFISNENNVHVDLYALNKNQAELILHGLSLKGIQIDRQFENDPDVVVSSDYLSKSDE